MKHQIFNKLRLILIEDKGKFTLYRTDSDITLEREKLLHMKAVDFIPANSTYIAVYPDCRLIVTDEAVFSLDGKILVSCNHKEVSLTSKLQITEIKIGHSQSGSGRLILWNGQKILLQTDYQKIVENEFYIAVELKKQWQVYDRQGVLKCTICPLLDEDIRLIGHFMVISGIGNHDLYSLKSGILLCSKKNIVLCSAIDDFAVCSTLNHRVEIYYCGKWQHLDNVSCFDLIDDLGLFYTQVNDKYYLYSYAKAEPVLHDEFPTGLDFVSYDSQSATLFLQAGEQRLILPFNNL